MATVTHSTADEILRLASRLFLELGYEGVTVDDVATRAGVTKATVYYYYGTKGELFTAAVMELMERIRTGTLAALRSEGTLRERLRRIAVLRLSVADPRMDFSALMHEAEQSVSEEQLLKMRLAEEELVRTFADEFSQAIARGELAAIDPWVAAHAFIALLSIGKTRNTTGDLRYPDVETIADQLVDLFWHGVSRSPSRA